MATISIAELVEEIGKGYLDQIIQHLELTPKDEYSEGEEDLKVIRAVRNQMKAMRSKSVANAIAAMAKEREQPVTQSKPKKASRRKRESKEVSSDLQAGFLNSSTQLSQQILNTGVVSGAKDAGLLNQGWQTGFAHRVIQDKQRNAKVIGEQVGKLTDVAINATTVDVESLLGKLEEEPKPITPAEEPLEFLEGEGLGFTGKFLEMCSEQEELPEPEEETNLLFSN
ncbi:MAG: hypothetical protein F6K58_08790 [Symploca sp. SIO2E9]|nr:hypothetical protein [Symploca sp. SIO2E9]